jgi:predicted acyltransferase
MIAARQIANRWYGQLAAIAVVGFGIAFSAVPAPTCALCSIGVKALHAAKQTQVGKEFLNLYAQHTVRTNQGDSL